MSKNLLIRVAKSSDYDAILTLIREHYYKEEPITISHPEIGHTIDDEAYSMSQIIHNTCIIGLNSENNDIVGVLISGPIEAEDAALMFESSKNSTRKWSDIQKLLAYIEKKANVLEKYKLEKALHCHILSVHQKYRGNGIGKKLFQYCFENAKQLGYKLISVDCTSIFSSKIAEKLNMRCISTVTYDEYNTFIEEKLFIPEDPNIIIKTYAKLL